MDWPSKKTMGLLIDINAGQEMEVIDGVLTVHRLRENSTETIQYETEILDALEERRWIEIVGEFPTLTDQGYYAVEKYARTEYGIRLNPRTVKPSGSLW